jgi:hypothetical protein
MMLGDSSGLRDRTRIKSVETQAEVLPGSVSV